MLVKFGKIFTDLRRKILRLCRAMIKYFNITLNNKTPLWAETCVARRREQREFSAENYACSANNGVL